MTPGSYFTALIAKSFGLNRRNKRLTEASNEMGLLRESEYHLGLRVWQDIEDIEELSVEYWNLRKLNKEMEASRERQISLNQDLVELHEKRSQILSEVSHEQSDLEDFRDKLMDRMQELTSERDSIIRKARDLRRAHEGFLAKIEVLKEKPDGEHEVAAVEAQIQEVKSTFRDLRKQRQEIANLIMRGDNELDELDAKLKAIQEEKKQRAAVVFNLMGEVNRELSAIRSSAGAIEVNIRQLLSEIGRYISRYDQQDPKCGEVARKEKILVGVMRMLRISISLNHKLADFK